MENDNRKSRDDFYSKKKTHQHTDTMLIVAGLPLNRTSLPALPDTHALRNLIETLGEGTQAFIFAEAPFVDRQNELQCSWWCREFEHILQTAGIADTSFYVDFGRREMAHGSEEAAKNLYGHETERFCGKNFRPTAVRIFGTPAWSSSTKPTRRDLCDGIVKVLETREAPGQMSGPVIFDNASVAPDEHSPFWLREWLARSGARSTCYRRIMAIEWSGVMPVVV